HCSAADPDHTPNTRVGLPPTAGSSGTVTSINNVPALIVGAMSFNVAICAAKGTVNTTISAPAAASALAAPSSAALPPSAALNSAAAVCARCASREPM